MKRAAAGAILGSLLFDSPAVANTRKSPEVQKITLPSPSEREQTTARRSIEKENAAFLMNFVSRTGIEFDIYQTSIGHQQALEIDQVKLEAMLLYAFDQMDKGSTKQTQYPIAAIRDLTRKGRAGQLRGNSITMILSSDPDVCITRNPTTGNPNWFFSVPAQRSECVFIGLSNSMQPKTPGEQRSHHPTILVGQPRYSYTVRPDSYVTEQYTLNPKLRMLAIAATPIPTTPGLAQDPIPVEDPAFMQNALAYHELRHALNSLLGYQIDRSLVDKEHREIVYPDVNRFLFGCVVRVQEAELQPIVLKQ